MILISGLIGLALAMAWRSLGLPATFALIGEELDVRRRIVGFAASRFYRTATHSCRQAGNPSRSGAPRLLRRSMRRQNELHGKAHNGLSDKKEFSRVSDSLSGCELLLIH